MALTFEEKYEALNRLKPGAKFILRSGGLVWNDSGSAPTDSELEAEDTRYKNELASKKYQRDRAVAYPSLQEQFDLQYWDQVNGTTKWKEAIAKVKSDNPKP